MIKKIIFIFLLTTSLHSFAETVYVTRTGHRYHNENCKFLKKSRNSISLSDAKELGYLPCSKCHEVNPGNNSYHIEKSGTVSQFLLSDKGIGMALLLLAGAGGGVFYYQKRRNKQYHSPEESTFTELDKLLLKKLAEESKGISANDLNSLLSLDNKSLESQRKSRGNCLKFLNQKIKTNFKIADGIQRITYQEDRRIVYYILNSESTERLREFISNLN